MMTAFLSKETVAALTIKGILDAYNEVAAAEGIATRASLFRSHEAAVKAYEGLRLAYADGEPEATSPGLKRLRAHPSAEKVREAVVADQVKAANEASHRPTAAAKEPTTPPPVRGKGRPGRKPTISGSEIITVVAKENPKRGEAAERWAKYVTGQSVDQYAAAVRNRPKAIRDVRWDLSQGWLKLSGGK